MRCEQSHPVRFAAKQFTVKNLHLVQTFLNTVVVTGTRGYDQQIYIFFYYTKQSVNLHVFHVFICNADNVKTVVNLKKICFLYIIFCLTISCMYLSCTVSTIKNMFKAKKWLQTYCKTMSQASGSIFITISCNNFLWGSF